MLISDSVFIDDLDVEINIRHSWVGDLVIVLIHEDTGTTVTLLDQPGALDPEFEPGCRGDDIDAVFDDGATRVAEDECGDDSPTLSGRLTPNQPLGAFDGESVLGSWIIRIIDREPRDRGTLDEWSLRVNEPDLLVGDVNCDGRVNSIDAALTLQLSAGLVSSLACQGAADANLDGAINAIDAALILQLGAGLIGQLPP
ncbi:MAG: proprotein convertase P-domain-containing protein [Chloroflexi bacterium]|nr:proprotein convertase P-domain-containing protein [Chloroflexota bacterium]